MPAYDWRHMMAATDYDRLARVHRPDDTRRLHLEIRRLVADGLKPRDVAQALRVDLGVVLEALKDSAPPEAA